MKRNNILYRIAALLLFVTLTVACTNEDDYATPRTDGTTPAAPLTITVTDGAYASAESPDNDNTPATRAVERGYGTEFTKGDRIGLYVVEKEDASEPSNANRTFLQQNLCLTHDGTGWTLPVGMELTHQPPKDGEILYFAYYPYQEDMADKVDIYAQEEGRFTTEARYFFGKLINDWTPADDQSTYEAYTASDLMVARGEVAKRTDGTDGSVLSFTMEHQMALAVIRVPTTVYTYDETIDGVTTKKSYHLYCGLTIKGWMADDNTYRYLVNPRNSKFKISGSYYNASLEKCDFIGKTSPNESSKYFLFTVDEGGKTEPKRTLKEGDFYMRDGGIIPQEMIDTKMPDDVKEDCLGVVFWVGEKKDKHGRTNHWTHQTYQKKGDHLLMHDHPGCTHGIVVALKDAANEKKPWSSSSKESTFTWLDNYAATGQEAEKILILRSYSYGYSPSRCLQWFRDYGNNPTEAYNAIEDFAKVNPTPASCSGWYFPGEYETTVMALGTLNEDLNMTATLNTQFGKAGGDTFKIDGFYWSSTDLSAIPEESYCINFSNNEKSRKAKNNVGYVRAVLAF